jgi:ABC-2 family transporter
MSIARLIAAIARADFLERIRRLSFAVTLLFAVLLGYCAGTGKVYIRLDDYRGVYTSAWIGTMMSMVTTCFVTLVGFYIVKNTVERDRSTGVGQILAATPLSKPAYLAGKFLSNFLVLASMVVVLAVSAVAMKALTHEDPHFDVLALLSPFLFLALPAMALVAAFALLFETLPVLRTGFGNVVWFFVWSLSIGLPEITKIRWLDPTGLLTVGNNIMAEARRVIPGYKNNFSFTIELEPVRIAESLRYQGMDWTRDLVLQRFLWFVVALVIVLLATLFFDRFDPAPRAVRAAAGGGKPKRAAKEAAAVLPATTTAAIHLTPLAAHGAANAFGRLVIAELRLALQGYRWWWYVIAFGLLAAQVAAPLNAARGLILTAAWFWPVLIWSGMGARESLFGTSALLFSSARILYRQLPACLAAGFVVAALTGAGAGVRLLLAHDRAGFFAWCVAALFLPALALALGVLSGSSKFFEGLYVAWWYIGPLNHTRAIDFTGAANGPLTVRYGLLYLFLSVGLLVVAFMARSRQLRHV